MFDQRAFIERVEAANVDGFAQILASPTTEEEAVLRDYFGAQRYRSLRGLVLRGRTRAGERAKEGNVVVLHGIMGGELSTGSSRLWLRIPRIIFGGLRALRLTPDGKRDLDPGAGVTASGILKQYYGELLIYLADSWNVKAFWYDWRRDLDETAAQLNEQIGRWFGPRAPVHLVAHSMGGLLARTFMINHPDRWQTMWDDESGGRRGGRLVMLGTPNHGSYSIPQVLTGLAATVKKVARADLTHDVNELLQIFNSFPGVYHLLPSPDADPAAEPLYEARSYPGFPVAQLHLNGAREHHRRLRAAVDPRRMVYVAGYNHATLDGVDPARVGDPAAYRFTAAGDGSVTHKLGLLEGVTSYYVECEHADLSANATVLPVVDALLRNGKTTVLSTSPPALRGDTQEELRRRRQEADEAEVAAVAERSARLQVRGQALDQSRQVPQQELELTQLLSAGLLGRAMPQRKRAAPPAPARSDDEPRPPLRIRLHFGRIEQVGGADGPGGVDAVAVGHYRGVRPMAAEKALGRAASFLDPAAGPEDDGRDVVTELTDRGTFRGHLGQIFFLPFPARKDGNGGAPAADRVLALCGLGEPGRLGIPELTVGVRELVWSLGRLGRRHLASVLIGGGAGNLSVPDAVSAWLAGIASARRGDARPAGWLTDLTLVEADLERLEQTLAPALDAEVTRINERVGYPALLFARPSPQELGQWRARRAEVQSPGSERESADPDETPPTVITVSCEQAGRYRFGALTDKASIPERELSISAELVQSANQELAEEGDPDLQLERGQLLHGLLVPGDLRSRFSSSGPLILVVDHVSARLHWEMMAQPEDGARRFSEDGRITRDDSFFGIARGLTRRLRTALAPVPEPQPHPARTLRVLVVADPSAEARLPQAEYEGYEVASLFEAFNRFHAADAGRRVQVVSLVGPQEATATNVLRELLVRQYDVLHFAGHCYYDADHPQASGWIFSNGRKLTALELDRIDRVPLFVFSNACESGVTGPDSGRRDPAGLAPSFAEAFFAQGVANFVCTAWQIEDATARHFALRLYASLLGLDLDALVSQGLLKIDGWFTRPVPEGQPPPALTAPFRSMTDALRDARRAIAGIPGGERTWGAYQHYGNPHYRFFRQPQAAAAARAAPPRPEATPAPEPEAAPRAADPPQPQARSTSPTTPPAMSLSPTRDKRRHR